MQVVVHKETREFLSSYHGTALLPHHEVIEVADDAFNLAISDCMQMGPHCTLDIFEDGRMSIRQGERTPAQIATQELRDYAASGESTAEQMDKALRNLIRLVIG